MMMRKRDSYTFTPTKFREFIALMEREHFLYNPHTRNVFSEGLGGSLGDIDRGNFFYLFIHQDKGNEPSVVHTERARLQDLAENFE